MERTYKTQMEAAKMGIVTPEMKIVAQKEYRTEEEIREWGVIKNTIRDELSKLLYDKTRRSPMILPIIMEV